VWQGKRDRERVGRRRQQGSRKLARVGAQHCLAVFGNGRPLQQEWFRQPHACEAAALLTCASPRGRRNAGPQRKETQREHGGTLVACACNKQTQRSRDDGQVSVERTAGVLGRARRPAARRRGGGVHPQRHADPVWVQSEATRVRAASLRRNPSSPLSKCGHLVRQPVCVVALGRARPTLVLPHSAGWRPRHTRKEVMLPRRHHRRRTASRRWRRSRLRQLPASPSGLALAALSWHRLSSHGTHGSPSPGPATSAQTCNLW
jgi:hypothetical protein